MFTKEQLLKISELNLVEKTEQMDEEALKNYSLLLNSFADDFSEQEDKIKAAIETKDYDTLKKQISAFQKTLENIYADELAQECLKHINKFDSETPEKLEAFISYFLSSLSMLSIDIQMAEQNNGIKAAEPAANTGKTEQAASENKILAVDDTPFFLTVLKTTLQNTKYKLICVTNGKDALKYLEKNNPNLFLLDIEMPGMDGYELAVKIKENGHKAPIIFLTGNAKRDSVTRAMQSGAVDFVIKPINKDLLLTKIAKYIL